MSSKYIDPPITQLTVLPVQQLDRLSLLDEFAIAAMSTYIGKQDCGLSKTEIACASYELAEAMVLARRSVNGIHDRYSLKKSEGSG